MITKFKPGDRVVINTYETGIQDSFGKTGTVIFINDYNRDTPIINIEFDDEEFNRHIKEFNLSFIIHWCDLIERKINFSARRFL